MSFKEFVQSIPIIHPPNPYWALMDGQVLALKYSFEDLYPLFWKVKDIFQHVWLTNKTECQVVIVEPDTIPEEYIIFTDPHTKLSIGILPQTNTPATTETSDTLWRQVFGNRFPVLRIHSHHILKPYQSHVDAASLNSGTLELVFGHIQHPDIHLAGWLDIYGDPYAKTHIFYDVIKKSQPNQQTKGDDNDV